jgi:hypothetical protein
MGLRESSTGPEGEVEVSEEQSSWSEEGLESRRGRSDRKWAINACKKGGFEMWIWIGLRSSRGESERTSAESGGPVGASASAGAGVGVGVRVSCSRRKWSGSESGSSIEGDSRMVDRR